MQEDDLVLSHEYLLLPFHFDMIVQKNITVKLCVIITFFINQNILHVFNTVGKTYILPTNSQ